MDDALDGYVAKVALLKVAVEYEAADSNHRGQLIARSAMRETQGATASALAGAIALKRDELAQLLSQVSAYEKAGGAAI